MPLGLYISVPFCKTKCSFCNFASDVFSRSAYENYVARLLEDIGGSRRLALDLGWRLEETVDSIYLGGGTPSILDGPQLRRIFTAIRDQFAFIPNCEITVECAPGTVVPALIETLQQCGVNRISLGVQSFVDQEAHSVGRLHNRAIVLEEIERLRKAGLDNISIDLIAGLPHQTRESWAFSVSETIATGVPHASVYMLEVDDDSRLGRELMAGGARYHAHFVPDDDATADYYQQACEMLEASGMPQYEISNFARTGTEAQKNELGDDLQNEGRSDDELRNQSRHNLKYWTRQPYLGFGVDAHSMLHKMVERRAPSPVHLEPCQAVRFATPDSLEAYMNRAPHTVTPVSEQAAIEESFFLGLRLNHGIDVGHLLAGGGIWDQHGEGHDFSRATNAEGKTALQFAEELDMEKRAPEGAIDSAIAAVSLKRYPDTKKRYPDTNERYPDTNERYADTKERCLETKPSISANCLAAEGKPRVDFWESAIRDCVRDGLLEKRGKMLRLTARGRLLSNEVFARFLNDETKVGTDHVNPR
jgi:oxygen-independent coproporphyrinogen-3 oxidase